jgi:hypothetical protein
MLGYTPLYTPQQSLTRCFTYYTNLKLKWFWSNIYKNVIFY